MTTLNHYRIYCNTETAYVSKWGTEEPTVCPNDPGHSINTDSITVVESIAPHETTVVNFPHTAFGEMLMAEMTPLLQLGFTYNLLPQITVTDVTGSGTVTHADQMVVASTGAATNSSARLGSLIPVKYRPGQGVLLRFTGLFSPGVAGNTQMIGGFDSVNGMGFGYDGTDFGVFRRRAGTTNWVAQTAWNIDKLDGTGPSGITIDFSAGFGNVFQIEFQVGFGGIIYKVENPGIARFTTVHVEAYANTATVPSLTTASFPMRLESNNTTNNTDILVKSASLMGAVEGKVLYTGPQFSGTWSNQSVANNSESMVAGFRVKTTFNGITNRTIHYATSFFAASGTTDKPQILRFRKGVTFTSPVWTDTYTGQSIMEQLTGGTWNNDGYVVYSRPIAGKGDPTAIEIVINENSWKGYPGDVFIITLEGINGTGTSTGSLNWLEDQ